MTDPRLRKLANSLVNYSCEVRPGEKVLIEVFDCEDVVAEELVKAVYEAGGLPFINMYRTKPMAAWLKGLSAEGAELQAKWDEARMKDMDAYISFRGNENGFENADVPRKNTEIYGTVYGKRVHLQTRVPGTKWVVLRYPNAAMAQMAGMSTRAFEDFYFDVCNLDYEKMDRAMTPLVDLMYRTDRVRLTGKGTDLSFSIKGIDVKKCSGKRNIPDGEVYTAPVRESVNGEISYNAPSNYNGFRFENVRLVFKDGKITEASANDSEKANAIFDTDTGSRYVGEFAIGVNPYVTKAMGDILFDEKIAGSIHFTPGACYKEAWNGNISAVHWDLVLIQTEEHGGGEIWFDDVLVRKNGRFVLPELECLNPENLK